MTFTSAPLGDGSPLGWLCAQTNALHSNDRTAENLATGNQCRINRSQRDKVPTQGMILAVEIHAVESLLHGTLIERGPEVIGDFLGTIEPDFFAEGNK